MFLIVKNIHKSSLLLLHNIKPKPPQRMRFIQCFSAFGNMQGDIGVYKTCKVPNSFNTCRYGYFAQSALKSGIAINYIGSFRNSIFTRFLFGNPTYRYISIK